VRPLPPSQVNFAQQEEWAAHRSDNVACWVLIEDKLRLRVVLIEDKLRLRVVLCQRS
jgi:hypothetical protein